MIIRQASKAMILSVLGICVLPAAGRTIDGVAYTATDDVDYNWIEISGTGTKVAMSNSYEEVPVSISGFDFRYYGREVTNFPCVYVTSYGVIGVSSSVGQPINHELPYRSYGGWFPSPFLAPYADHLWSTSGVAGPSSAVYYQMIGTPGARQMVIQWQDVVNIEVYDQGAITFQAILHEGSDEIVFQYKDVDFEGAAEYGRGAKATVGIQGPVWTDYSAVQWSYQTASLSDGYAIKFTPKPIPAPLSLTSTYTVNVSVATNAHAGDGGSGDDSQTSSSTGSGWTNASAIASASGMVMDPWWNPDTQMDEPYLLPVCAGGSANAGGGVEQTGSSNGMVCVRARFSLDAWGDSHPMNQWNAGGSGEVTITGTLDIGTSEDMPEGYADLMLWLDFKRLFGSETPLSSMSGLIIWAEDPSLNPDAVPVIETDKFFGSTSMLVTAGQRLYFEYSYIAFGDVDSYEIFPGPYMEDVSIEAKLVPVPEPATLSLLALGGLALIRRRRTA